MKLALLGVNDALSATFGADAKEYQEALENLAPAAREAVTAVRGLAPELRKVQQAVQQAFFERFAGQVEGVIRSLLPFKANLQNIAAQFGAAADEGLRFAQSKRFLTNIGATSRAPSTLSVGLSAVSGGDQWTCATTATPLWRTPCRWRGKPR
ncbi:hypothetical protein ACIQ9R_31030 [Streptomyces sp. NPDC094447]|uniref:hypothetical protein n=1 Tax=Streptomyces sp. NPDC094447 TaxID=3366062 RepID=UPI0038011C4C